MLRRPGCERPPRPVPRSSPRIRPTAGPGTLRLPSTRLSVGSWPGIWRSKVIATEWKAAPLTDDILALVATDDPAALAEARDSGLLLVGHMGAFHGSKLPVPHVADWKAAQSLAVTVRRSKVDHEGLGRYKVRVYRSCPTTVRLPRCRSGWPWPPSSTARCSVPSTATGDRAGQGARLVEQHLDVMVQLEMLFAPVHQSHVAGNHRCPVEHLDRGRAEPGGKVAARQSGGHRVEALADAHAGLGVDPHHRQPPGRVERLDRQLEQRWPFGREVFPDGGRARPDTPGVVGHVTGPAQLVQFGQIRAHRHRDQVRPAKSSYLALDPTLFGVF